MRILILGGTGQTGPFAVRRLHNLGHEVTVFHRGQHHADLPPGVRRVHGDLSNPPAELLGMALDVVIHMWVMNEPDAHTFVRCFRGSAGRSVVVSSCDVYRAYARLQRAESGPPDPIPLAEDAPLRESRYPYRNKPNAPIENVDVYDKILVENAVRAHADFPATILRFPAVYGPNDYHRFAPWVRQMDAGVAELRIQDGFARWRWTHGFVEDVAEAVVLAAINPDAAGRIYNVGEVATPTWQDRIEAIGRAAGWSGWVMPVPASELPEEQRSPLDFTHHLEVDTTSIRRELGYGEIIPPEEALRRTIEWERKKSG